MFRQSYSQGQKERVSPKKEDVAEAFKTKSQTVLQIWEGILSTQSSMSR